MKAVWWVIFHLTLLVAVPALALADFFTTGHFDLLERWGRFCGVEGHDPELF